MMTIGFIIVLIIAVVEYLIINKAGNLITKYLIRTNQLEKFLRYVDKQQKV